MKNVKVSNNLRLLGVKNFEKEERMVDYYLVYPGQLEKQYAFSKRYTNGTYDLCKSGIRVNELLSIKKNDCAVMKLVERAKMIVPYMAEEYDLPLAA